VQHMERNIYSSQKVSEWLRGRTSKKRKSQNNDKANLSKMKQEVDNEQKRRRATSQRSLRDIKQDFQDTQNYNVSFDIMILVLLRSKYLLSFNLFGYWSIFDLTQESFHGCTEFTQSEINQISQDFSDRVHWSPEPAHKYLQRYFESNCDPSKVVDIEDHAMFKLVETKQQKHSSKNYIWRICVESIDEQLSSIVRSQS
ncbi:hypothetical protein GLOIN_2v1704847, partial [Rhizophagus irregularis DAOM 181602=DAOM 197198]